MRLTIETLGQIIQERFKIDRSRVVAEATLDELGFDSLSQVDLTVLVERKAGVKIEDDQLTSISCISDLLAVVNEGV